MFNTQTHKYRCFSVDVGLQHRYRNYMCTVSDKISKNSSERLIDFNNLSNCVTEKFE